ncbi:unnamed protein product [Caenorhabditis bovis]|uniref:ribonuclease Z n=1 Tax=Caenorhabditis bovis TaxID=2654633 RepID=A0A8S1F3X9_9PELO|nr:unnamed protein product [Caenorhabditis bovis]
MRGLASYRRFLTWSNFRVFSSSSAEHIDEDLLESIKQRIERNRRILKKHSASHFKAREISASIGNLRQSMASVQKKQKAAMEPAANSIVNIPNQVSIEILGNATGLLRACVVIRTPLKTYMFNCPENACRFMWQLRLRASNIVDIFVTAATWDNIAGISSILLAKESSAMTTRLHGAMNVKHFLECIRPFQDSDYGSCKYPSQVEERPYTMESYEDAGVKVSYIPLSPPLDMQKEKNGRRSDGRMKRNSEVDVAFLVELKPPPRRVDPLKLMEKKVPKGPLIGKLKMGETVTLPDGRTIEPGEILSDAQTGTELPIVLVAECDSEEHAKALLESTAIQAILSGEKHLDYFVHLSSDKVTSSESYKKLLSAIDAGNEVSKRKTRHLLVNETNPWIPSVESVYKHTKLLNHIAPRLFPNLHPLEWSGLVAQNDELSVDDGRFVRVAPLQRFWMRRPAYFQEEPIIMDLRDVEMNFSESAQKLIGDFQNEQSLVEPTCEYPIVTFLGTSSAVPSKYRNVTGYLIEASKQSAFLLDVGEGTYGQMRAIFGEEQCKNMLTNLHCVMITHAHQDHMNGLYTIIYRRKEAFEELGLPYKPLILVCNRNVMKPLKTYSICFENIESLIELVDISRHPITPPSSPNGASASKRPRLPSPHLPPARNILAQISHDMTKYGLTELKAVQVHHTRMANGYVLGVAGKRLVFSGDTKPCDLLCDEGKNADLLVHEATFEDGHEADALKKRHSTMGQAVDVGQKMSARHVILTHFSARYPKVPVLPEYLDEKRVGVAMDMLRVRFDHLHLLHKLIPIYREIFVEELFELTVRKEQRMFKEQELEKKRALVTH